MISKRRLDPGQALRAVARVLGGRISIRLSMVRSRLAGISEKVALDIDAASPGLRVRGEAHTLGAPIFFAARVDAEGVQVRGEARTVRIHLSEVELWTDDDAPGPLADAIRNGLIDTANPATLIGNMVPLPDMVVDATGRDVVIDLLKIPAIQRDERLRSALAAATSYLCVTGIEVVDDALELRLGILPGGPKEAVLATARAALTPVVRYLWPEGRP
ncbi:MAG: hypothetical protein WAU39_06460 [Polyangiales bacterium]